MATIPEALAIALELHRSGRLREAEQTYRQILAIAPNQADAWHLLGVISSQLGEYPIAIEHINRAINLHGTEAAFHGNLAIALAKSGNLDAAVASYRRALQLKPDFADAHDHLGDALMAQGNLEEAVACYRRALTLRPDNVETHYKLGNALKQQGKLEEAARCYRRALTLKPDYADAYNNLGNALAEQGSFDKAVTSYQRALELKPDFAEANNNLGNTLSQQGKPEEAVACYLRAIELKPHYPKAYNNLGNAFLSQGKTNEAISAYYRAVEQDPGYVEAHCNLANVFTRRGKYGEAVLCCRRALETKPDYAEAYNDLGNVFSAQGKLDEAIAGYRQAIEWKPDFAQAHCNLGNVYTHRRELANAVACYYRALQLKPDYAEGHYELGNALNDQGKSDEAVRCFRRALELKPDYLAAAGALGHALQHICQWKESDELSQRVTAGIDGGSEHALTTPVSPFGFLALPTTTAKQQLLCARRWVERHLMATGAPEHNLVLNRQPDRKSKLTVGYLSADYRPHPVAYLIAELFEKHDRSRFSVFGYSIGADDGSSIRRRIEASFDRFVDLRNDSFMDAAQRICRDGVDILVDLTGYTKNSRTRILALRPAPVQVNYLGYTATMGAPFMDYIVVDRFVVPPEQQPFFTEKLVHLPGCYQVNNSQREISPHTPLRAECGLPEDGFVFCCFNNSYKITAQMFDVWMRLLKAVPGSVLWLPEGNGLASPNLRREAVSRGVAGERLVFAARTTYPDYLARYQTADLFLDTFPFNAHSTAGDALWADCPVLTLAGETFVSRVAGSMLHTIGLPELVTTSFDEYEEMALQLSRDKDLLGELRARLETNRDSSPLFNAEKFSRNIEKAYSTMWEIHASGEKPRSFAVDAT